MLFPIIIIMRILIVNGYGHSDAGKRRFDRYSDMIRKVFLNQKELLDTETEFFSRDAANLDDFLFDQDSGFSKVEAIRQFDFLDFVFIEMDPTLRPWAKFASKIMVLVRMCLRTNKIFFASAGAMQALVFFVATNLETPVEVINGPQGSHLGDMSKLQKSLDTIGRSEYFLDNVTGDLYGIHYNQDQFQNSWVPIANCGIHSRKAVEEFNTVGKYMLKAPVYKPKTMKEIYGVYTSTDDEEICIVKKNYIQSHLFRDMKQEFLVHSKHSWDIHPFNVLNPKKVFMVLAESQRGPQVIKINENIVGVQFDLDAKYPETQMILRNFIIHHLVQIRSELNNPISIAKANNELRKNKLDLENMTKQQAEIQQKGQKSTLNFEVLTKFKHVGFAGKRAKKLEIVMNNAINDQGQMQEAIKTIRQKHTSRQKSPTEGSETKKIGLARLSTKMADAPSEKDKFNKTAAEIRQMLHPNISEQGVPENEPLWVPGNMQQSQLQNQGQGQVVRQATQSQSRSFNRPGTAESRAFTLTRVRTAKSRMSKPIADYDECRMKPIVRCSSPYITPMEQERLDQKMKDSKILGPKTIKLSSVMQSQNASPLMLFDTPYQPLSEFKYRDENKGKWVGDQDFRLC